MRTKILCETRSILENPGSKISIYENLPSWKDLFGDVAQNANKTMALPPQKIQRQSSLHSIGKSDTRRNATLVEGSTIEKLKTISMRRAAMKVILPDSHKLNNKSIVYNAGSKSELAKLVKLSNSTGSDMRKINNVKSRKLESRREIETEFHFNQSNEEANQRYRKIKQESNRKKLHNILGNFNDYLIRNYVFLDRKTGALDEARRQWEMSEDFFHKLSTTRKKKVKKNVVKLNHSLSQDGDSEDSFMYNKLTFEQGTVIKQEKIMHIKNKKLKRKKIKEERKLQENRKLQQEIDDISESYDSPHDPIHENDLINKKNLIRSIKRFQIEKKFVDPLRRIVLNPSNIKTLKQQNDEIVDSKAVLLRKINLIPCFVSERLKLKTVGRFNNIKGKGFGMDTNRIN